jgi:hypothetical protein
MLLVFLDTEFTGFDRPELISIGLASASDTEFYAELCYTHSSCSKFAHNVVIPLLSLNYQVSRQELRANILSWLNSIRNNALLVACFDSHYDKGLFINIFDNESPSFIIFRCIGYRHINGLIRAEFYRKNSLNEHHALNDAMALRYSFRGWIRAVR